MFKDNVGLFRTVEHFCSGWQSASY